MNHGQPMIGIAKQRMGADSIRRSRRSAILVTGQILFTLLAGLLAGSTDARGATPSPVGPLTVAVIELRIFASLIDSLRCTTNQSLQDDADCARFLEMANQTISNATQVAQNPTTLPTVPYALLRKSMERTNDPQAFFYEPEVRFNNRQFAERLQKLGPIKVMRLLRDAYHSFDESDLKQDSAQKGASIQKQVSKYSEAIAKGGSKSAPPKALVLLSLELRKADPQYADWTAVSRWVQTATVEDIGLLHLIAEMDRP